MGSLTTASQSGGWVPETSRSSFHYCQEAPGWGPLQRLAYPGNPAMSPYAEGRKTGTHHTEKNSGKRGRDRGRETASKEIPHA